MITKKTFALVSVVGAMLIAACGGNGGGNEGGNGGAGAGTGTGTNTGTGTGTGTSVNSKFACCINDAKYRCPDKAAFDKCAGFDLDACIDMCTPGNFECMDTCFDQIANATNDPSDCTEDPSVTCGGSGGGGPVGSCVGQWDGKQCDYDADCASNNCFENKCYATTVGNPCDYDADCDSNNCYNSCCNSNSAGSGCDYDADCTSDNCYNNVCQ